MNSRSKREDAVVQSIPNNVSTTNSKSANSMSNSNDTTTTSSTTVKPSTVDTQITKSNAERVQILSITPSIGDRLVIFLASTLKPDVDYILELSFEGTISDTLTGFYKSTYRNKGNIEKYVLIYLVC